MRTTVKFINWQKLSFTASFTRCGNFRGIYMVNKNYFTRCILF